MLCRSLSRAAHTYTHISTTSDLNTHAPVAAPAASLLLHWRGAPPHPETLLMGEALFRFIVVIVLLFVAVYFLLWYFLFDVSHGISNISKKRCCFCCYCPIDVFTAAMGYSHAVTLIVYTGFLRCSLFTWLFAFFYRLALLRITLDVLLLLSLLLTTY